MFRADGAEACGRLWVLESLAAQGFRTPDSFPSCWGCLPMTSGSPLDERNLLSCTQSFFELSGSRVGNLLKASDAQKKMSQEQHGNKNNFVWWALLLREGETSKGIN